ncbi:hypothetical protein [Geobacillus sp. C56-T2]|uniref:hypothetical protein n=1 Tax=Geobacillus sp. C56-T2 TaxID=600773 RepID=UPI00155EA655|nr:hypothetical protein [Geobacillus sp. C56-T2]
MKTLQKLGRKAMVWLITCWLVLSFFGGPTSSADAAPLNGTMMQYFEWYLPDDV